MTKFVLVLIAVFLLLAWIETGVGIFLPFMKAAFAVQLLTLAATFFVLYLLWRWTDVAFHPPLAQMDEAFAKPWRPWARLAFSAILAVLMLGTHAYIAARSMRS